MAMLKCTSCNKSVANDAESTDFPCPKCGKAKIVRCGDCRKISVKYKCAECSFVGP